jgi:hypothetical protein
VEQYETTELSTCLGLKRGEIDKIFAGRGEARVGNINASFVLE